MFRTRAKFLKKYILKIINLKLNSLEISCRYKNIKILMYHNFRKKFSLKDVLKPKIYEIEILNKENLNLITHKVKSIKKILKFLIFPY